MRHVPPASSLALVLLAGLAAGLLIGLAAPASAQLTGTAPLPGDTAVGPLAGAKWEPRIAAGAGQYLAVWTDQRAALAPTVELDPWEVVQSDVFAARLGPDGQPLGLPIRVDAGPYSQEAPAVAFNGSGFLVAYESRSVSSTGFFTTQDVRAVRLSASGEVLDTTPLPIAITDEEVYVPAVGSDGTDFAVFWRGDAGILGRRVGAGGALGPVRTLTPGAGWTFDPVVAFAGDRYLLVWEGTGIQALFLDTALNPLGSIFSIPVNGNDPEVATDGTDFFVTVSKLGTWAEVRGTVVRADGTIVNPGGLLLDGQSYLALTPAQVAWDGNSYVTSWTEWQSVFPDTLETLRYNRVSADGVLQFVSPPAVESSLDFSVRDPVTASLGTGTALLGWIDNRFGSGHSYNGRLAVLDGAGGLSPDIGFTVGPPAQLGPDLAAGPAGAALEDDVNLVVFVSADAAETRVVYQRVDGHGAPLDPEPVVVAGGTDTYTGPVAAWNGQVWLVVWEDRAGGTGNGGVLAARVAPDGTVLDPTPFAVLDGNGPDVGALQVLGGDFLLAASKLTSGDIRTLYGRRVGGDGSLLEASPFFLGVNFALSPTVAGFDDRWLVAWHRRPTHDTPSSYLHARFVTDTGAVLAEFDPTNSTTDELTPDLVVDGDVATLAWSDGTDIRVRRIQQDGTPLGSPAGVLVSAAQNEQIVPTVCVDGAKTTVTWVDDRIHDIFEPGIGDLYGARLDHDLTVLEPDGVGLAADPFAPEGEAAMTGRSGVTVVATPAVLPAFGNWRVSVGTWRDWDAMGGSAPGAGGLRPELRAMGLLTEGSELSIEARDALAWAPGWLIVGFTPASVPLYGGTLVPFPDLMVLMGADGSGALTVGGVVPAALPSGFDLYLQAWFADGSAFGGWSATGGLHAEAP